MYVSVIQRRDDNGLFYNGGSGVGEKASELKRIWGAELSRLADGLNLTGG